VDFEANSVHRLLQGKVNILSSFFGDDSRRGPVQQLANRMPSAPRDFPLMILNILTPLKTSLDIYGRSLLEICAPKGLEDSARGFNP
jgi:hypothetical protein